MQREIILTRDGSHSVSIPGMNVTYHSIHGALQESTHVFIQAGLHYIKDVFPDGQIRILEIGLGTGLNALLTLRESIRLQLPVHYTALEPFPLDEQEAKQLNYAEQMGSPELQSSFDAFHTGKWEEETELTPLFTFCKTTINLLEFTSPPQYHLIYFDAFAPSAQPELWTEEVFGKLCASLFTGGVLVTYCSKSVVRRAMKAAGFTVKKIQGPHGKREMVRAVRMD